MASQVEALEPRQLLAGAIGGSPAADVIVVKSASVSADMAPQNNLLSNIVYSVTETAGPSGAQNLNQNPGAGQFGYSVDSNGVFTWDVSPSQATGDYTFSETVSGDSGYSSSGTYSRSFTVGVKSVGFDNSGELVVVGPADANSNISIGPASNGTVPITVGTESYSIAQSLITGQVHVLDLAGNSSYDTIQIDTAAVNFQVVTIATYVQTNYGHYQSMPSVTITGSSVGDTIFLDESAGELAFFNNSCEVFFGSLGSLTLDEPAGNNSVAMRGSPRFNTTIDGNTSHVGAGSSLNSIPPASDIGPPPIEDFQGHLQLLNFDHATFHITGNFYGSITSTPTSDETPNSSLVINSLVIGGSLEPGSVIEGTAMANVAIGGNLDGEIVADGGPNSGSITNVFVGGDLKGLLAGSTIGNLTISGALTGTLLAGDFSSSSIDWNDPSDPFGALTVVQDEGPTGSIATVAADRVTYSGTITGKILSGITISGVMDGAINVAELQFNNNFIGDMGGTITVVADGSAGSGVIYGTTFGDIHGTINAGELSGDVVLGNMDGTIITQGAAFDDIPGNPIGGIYGLQIGNLGGTLLAVADGVSSTSGVIFGLTVASISASGVVDGAILNNSIVTGQMAGTIAAQQGTGSIYDLTIYGSVSGMVTSSGSIDGLSIYGDLAGAVSAAGTISNLYVENGSVLDGATIAGASIVNSTITGDLAGTVIATGAGGIYGLYVNGDLSGSVTASSSITYLYTGSLSYYGSVTASSISYLRVNNGDLAGSVTASGTISDLHVYGGNITGSVTASTITGLSTANYDGTYGYLYGTVTASTLISNSYLGGVSFSGVIQGTVQTSIITGDTIAAGETIFNLQINGGLYGTVTASTITNMYVGNAAYEIAGNLAGFVMAAGDISNLSISGYLSGTVTASSITGLNV
ncbi:MAG TPA: hypothetical protein VGH74_05085, partial [Planctomycetaceae bacterium]